MNQEQQSPESRNLLSRLYQALFPPSIRNKIILPYLLLTLGIAIAGVYIVTQLVVGKLDERLNNQLKDAGGIVLDELGRRETEHVETIRQVLFVSGFRDALQNNDQTTMVELAKNVLSSRRSKLIEFLIVTNAEGQSLFYLTRRDDGGYETHYQQVNADLPLVQTLLAQGNPDAPPVRGLLSSPNDPQQYYYFTALPIGIEGKVAGVMMVGISLDSLLVRFRQVALADVIIYADGGRAIAATFTVAEPAAEREKLLKELSITPAMYEQSLKVSETQGEGTRVRERWYRTARGPLRVGNSILGVFATVLPMDFVTQTNAANRNVYVLIFSIGAIGVIVIGYSISHRIIVRPIKNLVDVSQAVAEGDLTQRTGIRSQDEIGTLAGTFDDMTDKLADRTQRLEETLGQLRAILASMGDGVIMEDLNGNIITLNTAAESMLAKMSADFFQHPVRDLSMPTAPTPVSTPDGQTVLQFPDHRRFEIGSKVISVHSAAVQAEDGDELGTVLVMRDVTSEVAAERLKDQFITHVSHELRTPLTAIKGYSDLLLSGAGGELNENQQSFIATVNRNTDDLIAMVNELIDFSEMEASGKLGIVKRPLDLRAIVEDVAEEWRPRMEEKGLTFDVRMPARLPLVEADARRIRWAIYHLVRNALQYTHSDGRVTVRLFERAGRVTLEVKDTGIGISPQDQEHLFSRFYRVTNMPEGEVRGLGVGLYLTKAIVEGHGGTIHVSSQLGAGSTFSIILPVWSEEHGRERATASA